MFSRYLRDRKEHVSLLDRLETSLLTCRLSSIVVMESECGAAKQPEVTAFRQHIERLKAVVPHVGAFDEAAAYHTEFVRALPANQKPDAQPIGTYDALLAGHALALGATFVTHNTREFSRVLGLSVENWQK